MSTTAEPMVTNPATTTVTEVRTETEDGPVAHIVKTLPGEDAAAKVLAARVEGTPIEALCGHVWVFHNRRRSALKLLFWDTGGFVLVYKRLARGRFRVPEVGDTAQVRLSAAELTALLEGIDLSRAKRLARWNPPDDVVDPQRSDSRAHEPGHAPRRPRSPQGAGARPG